MKEYTFGRIFDSMDTSIDYLKNQIKEGKFKIDEEKFKPFTIKNVTETINQYIAESEELGLDETIIGELSIDEKNNPYINEIIENEINESILIGIVPTKTIYTEDGKNEYNLIFSVISSIDKSVPIDDSYYVLGFYFSVIENDDNPLLDLFVPIEKE